MRIGDVVAAVIVVGVVLVLGASWGVGTPARTNANRYPDAGPPANLDSAARLVAAAASRAYERDGHPVRTAAELGALPLPPGARITRVTAEDSVGYVYITAPYKDTVLRCNVITRVIADRAAKRGARAMMYPACDSWYPTNAVEREEYYRMARERKAAREAAR